MKGKVNGQRDLFESSYGISDMSPSDWRIIRSMLKTLLRQSKAARGSSDVQKALNEITKDYHRDVFIRYYIKGDSIIKISMDKYYDESVVRSYLKSSVKEFARVYCDGLLIKPFITKE